MDGVEALLQAVESLLAPLGICYFLWTSRGKRVDIHFEKLCLERGFLLNRSIYQQGSEEDEEINFGVIKRKS